MKKYIIWGAGSIGRALASYVTKKNMPVKCIVDRDSKKWNETIEGLRVVNPNELLKNIDGHTVIIAVGSKYVQEVRATLEKYGIAASNIIMCSDVIKHDSNGSDMSFGAVSGYMPHDDGMMLLKSAYRDKILVDRESGNCRLIVRKGNEAYFAEVYDKIKELNGKCKYTRSILPDDNTDIKNQNEYALENIALYSYATEWPPEMYREMCLFYLDFLCECSRHGLTVDRVSYRDVVFWQGKFVYENILNIKCSSISYELIENFAGKFISVLLLMKENIYERAFWFINRDWEDMSLKDVNGYLSEEDINGYNALLENVSTLFVKNDMDNVFQAMKQYVRSVNLKARDVYQWDSYQYYAFENLENEAKWSEKQKLVIDMIKETRAKTMIDLAGNMGWYCVAMKDYMKHAVVADIDYNSIDFAFGYIRKQGIKNVYPIQLNLIAPPQETYKNIPISSTGIEPWIKGATDRYKSDVAVALAIVHHLVFSQQLSFDEITSQMSLFTNRYLIIEFIHRSDKFVADVLKDNAQFDWYDEDNFTESLKKKFRIMRIGATTGTRTLYLCEIKERFV